MPIEDHEELRFLLWEMTLQPNNPEAHQIQGVNEPVTYSSKISPDVDALVSNTTYLPRHPILIPNTSSDSSDNHVSSVNITQPAIDALSSYLYSLFDEGSSNDMLRRLPFHLPSSRRSPLFHQHPLNQSTRPSIHLAPLAWHHRSNRFLGWHLTC